MNKITLPERLYYPLNKAAEKIGRDVGDLIHYGAIGAIRICADIVFATPENFTDRLVGQIPMGGVPLPQECIRNEWFDLRRVERNPGEWWYMGSGLFCLSPSTLKALDVRGDFAINYCYTGDNGIGFTLREPITMETSSLYIKAIDMHAFADEKPDSPKPTTKQIELIRALIKMLPETSDMDLNKAPASKLANILESAAAGKGVEFPSMDKNTFTKFLGRK